MLRKLHCDHLSVAHRWVCQISLTRLSERSHETETKRYFGVFPQCPVQLAFSALQQL